MTSKKNIQSYDGGKQMSPQTAEMLSKQQGAYQKSEQQHFPVEDKRQVARREHTNGSTPRKRS
jgi:hypothetical protein